MDRLDELLEAHPNVHRTAETVELPAEGFQTVERRVENGEEHFVGAVVTNEADEIALVQNWWSDGWVMPGGGAKAGETLEDAVAREVREETGLTVAVEKPVAVVDQTFVHGDASVWNAFVIFAARAETTTLAADPGVGDDEIEAVGWFASIPDECEHAQLLDVVFEAD